MNDIDRLIHEPARFRIMALLFGAEQVNFLFLMREAGLTKGNLSSHLAKLEESAYIKIEKKFRNKTSLTLVRLTPEGRAALKTYRKQMKELLRQLQT